VTPRISIPTATYFVRRLREAVDNLWPSVERSLRTQMSRDPQFKKQLAAWTAKQGIANFGDVAFYETVARQVVYRLVGKILFYQSLRRHVPTLPALDLAEVNEALVMSRLRDCFAEALKIDYQAVFEESIADHIPLPQAAIDELVALTEDLDRAHFAEVPQDVMGQVFEGLIPYEERHALGQYFTRENLVDLISVFCIRDKDDKVLDPACGTGTFLIRGYDRKKILGQEDHRRLLSQLWGVDIAHFPAELATINLFRQDLSDADNFPRIMACDFFEVTPGQTFRFPPPRADGTFGEFIEEPMPVFDAAVSNFPYIRQERIERRVKGYKDQISHTIAEDWLAEYEGAFKLKKRVAKDLANAKANGMDLTPFYDEAEPRLSGQADIYAYLFFHTARFLRPDGGRMGIVTSNAWLDVAYGYELQRFFLNNFKIAAILESRCEPWFEEAAINTIVTVLERCTDAEARDAHAVKFVKVKRPLAELIPWDLKTEAEARWEGLAELARRVENAAQAAGVGQPGQPTTYEDDDFRIRIVRQGALREEVEANGKTVKWGPYLRAPEVYLELLERCGDKLMALGEIAQPSRGCLTMLNEFFYLDDEAVRRWSIEEEYLQPLMKSMGKSGRIRIDVEALPHKVFICREKLADLRQEGKLGALRYIEWGTQQRYTSGRHSGLRWSENPWIQDRKPGWWAVPEYRTRPGQVVWSKAYHDRHPVRFSPKPFIPDCRLYFLDPAKGVHIPLLAAVLNSSIVALFLELTGRVILGEGVLDVMVEDARDYLLVPDVRQFTESDRQSTLTAFQPLLDRPIGSVFQEIKREDRQALDSAVLGALDLDPKEWLSRIYEGLTTLVRERIELGRMRNRRRKERVTRDTATLEQQALAEVLPKGPKPFPAAFFTRQIRQGEFETFALPHEPLRLERSPFGFGKYQLLTEDGTVIYEGNKFQADYVRYTQMAGQFIVQMPKQPHHVSKVLAEYRQYLRELRQRLHSAIYNRALDQAVAERLTEKVWRELGLPEVEGT
jgi:type I restriction enzyme M protein